jgi:hypothetical protein
MEWLSINAKQTVMDAAEALLLLGPAAASWCAHQTG